MCLRLWCTELNQNKGVCEYYISKRKSKNKGGRSCFELGFRVKEKMDITEVTLMHHVGIVLLFLWFFSYFNWCHPVAYFVSLIYLFLVILSLLDFCVFIFCFFCSCASFSSKGLEKQSEEKKLSLYKREIRISPRILFLWYWVSVMFICSGLCDFNV